MTRLPWLEAHDPFPAITNCDPSGLLAVGADLSPARLLDAYRHGIFPWYSENEPILWWSPAPRCVIYPSQFHASRSLRKFVRHHQWRITANAAFADVMMACATVDDRRGATWINPDMLHAYCEMHRLGWAHSLEVWQDDDLVGGIYGIAIGKIFFGESMFSRSTNASKVALLHLCKALNHLQFALLDCQVQNPHLESLGAQNISRAKFKLTLDQYCEPGAKLTNKIFQLALDKTLEQATYD